MQPVARTPPTNGTPPRTRQLFHCRSCSNPFNLADRLPRVLPCRHTVCQCCLRRHQSQQQPSSSRRPGTGSVVILCPTCRMQTATEGLGSLPLNKDVIDALQQSGQRAMPLGKTVEISTAPVGNSDKGRNVDCPPSAYCARIQPRSHNNAAVDVSSLPVSPGVKICLGSSAQLTVQPPAELNPRPAAADRCAWCGHGPALMATDVCSHLVCPSCADSNWHQEGPPACRYCLELESQFLADAMGKTLTVEATDHGTSAVQQSSDNVFEVQPSAPGLQTLQRVITTKSNGIVSQMVSHYQSHNAGVLTDGSLQNGSRDSRPTLATSQQSRTQRPPPFNPGCTSSCSTEFNHPDSVQQRAIAKELYVTSTEADSQPPANNGEIYPNAPPSYDEVCRSGQQTDMVNIQDIQKYGINPATRMNVSTDRAGGPSDPIPPVDIRSSDPLAGCITSKGPCVARFGKYSDIRTQPGSFSSPARISTTSVSSTVGAEGDVGRRKILILVVDPVSTNIQVFTESGDCLSMFRVPHASGGCCLPAPSTSTANNNQLLLAIATGSAVCIYELDGRLVKEMPFGRKGDGPVFTAVPYGQNAFIAVRPRSLSICRGGVTSPAVIRTLSERIRTGRARSTTDFGNIVNVAVKAGLDLVVLDAGAQGKPGAVYFMGEDCVVTATIRPAVDPRCGCLKDPFAIAVDRSGNVIISDTGNGRVLMFGAGDGQLLQTLLTVESTQASQLKARDTTGDSLKLLGLAVTGQDQLLVVVSGNKFAEVRFYTL